MKSQKLSKREQEVMDILYATNQADVATVQTKLAHQPTYSATRMLLQRLEKKGYITFTMQGAKYIYTPAEPKQNAFQKAWASLVNVFFAGSSSAAFSTLFDVSEKQLTDTELDELEKLIAKARKNRQVRR